MNSYHMLHNENYVCSKAFTRYSLVTTKKKEMKKSSN
jgi:hypothetical protein